ncbi:MAG: response regulator [Burkholderiaceae bacterium]|nr:MAG: response regulator [Burkholderiaceae bacterium]
MHGNNKSSLTLQIVLLAAAYYLTARLGLLLAFAGTNASPVWPPCGIALGALLILGYRLWPGIFIGAFAANFAVFSANHLDAGLTTGVASFCIAAGNTLEALTAAALLRLLVGERGYFTRQLGVYKFVLIVMAAAALGASGGTASLILNHLAPSAAAWPIFSTWWLGDFSGMLIVTPLFLAWSNPITEPPDRTATIKMASSLLVLLALLGLLFGQHYASQIANRWLAYPLLICVGWAAFQYGRRGVTLTLTLLMTASVLGTTQGLGPFATGTLQDSLMTLEIFIALSGLVGLILAADASEKRYFSRNTPVAQRLLPLLHWGALFIGLSVTVAAWHFISSSTERVADERFDFLAENVKKRIMGQMNTYATMLYAGQGLFSASKSVERDEWHAFVERLALEKNFPGAQGLHYAQAVRPGEQAALEKAVHADGYADFHIWPPGKRDLYVPVTYFEPASEKNLRAHGYDMFSEPNRRAAMLRARDSGDVAITDKLNLITDTGQGAQVAFLMFLPVYRNGAAIDTQTARAAALTGYVYSLFRMNDLMQEILSDYLTAMRVELFDGQGESSEALMYASASPSDVKQSGYPNALVLHKRFKVAADGHVWTLRLISTPVFEAGIDRQKSLIVLIAGTLISLMFFGVIGNLSLMREKAQALADEMTISLKEANQILCRSEERFRLLTSKIKDYAILLLDVEGRVQSWNEGARHLTGYAETEIVGSSFARFHTQEDLASGQPEHMLKQALILGHYETFGWKLHKDGSRFYADTLVSAIRDDQNELIGFALILRDITQEKRAENELRTAKEEAESASRAKSEFVANMSHELRTPMNAVLGMAHLLLETELSTEQKQYLDMIRASGQALMEIMNDILDFSKIEAGRMELVPMEFTLGEVLSTTATIMAVNGGEKDLDLAIGVAPDVPHNLIGDALRVQQVLVNLTGNAIKFTAQGEVSLFVDLVARQGNTATLRFRIRDSGIGMTDEQQKRLFTPFTQADSSMTRRFGGSGLGLTICKRLLDMMQGSIELHSVLGKGTEFIVTIPFELAQAQEEREPFADMQDLHILLVDDNLTNRIYLSETIRTWNWKTDCVASGNEALAHIARGQKYDVVLLDGQLQGTGTVSLIEEIRPALGDSTIPILFMVSAFGRGKLLKTPAGAQASGVLMKPVTGSNLFNMLHELHIRQQGKGSAALDSTPLQAMRRRLEGVHLLLVEDNMLNQVVAKSLLEKAGARVDVVDNGQMAIEQLRYAPERYDLVLMDVQMPVMDGFTATRLIRGAMGLTLPILAMTAGVTEAERIQCTEVGMDGFIAKPIEPVQMFTRIQRHLREIKRKAASPFSEITPVAAVPAQIPQSAIDLTQLLALIDVNPGNRAVIIDLIQMMVERGLDPLNAAHAAWQNEKSVDAAKICHALRGEIGNLGAVRFVQTMLDLEHALRDNAASATPPLFDRAEKELRAVLGEASLWLKTQSAVTT